MISKADQKRSPEWWKGKKVKTLRPMGNRLIEMQAGTVCIVVKKWGNLSLTSDACEKCGVRVHISDVPFSAVELMPDMAPPQAQKHA